MSKFNGLTPSQIQLLNQSFGLIHCCQRDIKRSIWLPQLFDHEQCERLLYQLTPIIHSPSIKVTASLLSKRYAFLATASSLYAMSVYDAGLDMSAENCYLDYRYERCLWQSKMPLRQHHVSHPVDHSQRQQWREMIVRALFANNISLVWKVLREVTNIHPRILWENTAVRVYSLYEKKMTTNHPIITATIAEDYNYLINEAKPDVFGIDYNPLKRYNYNKIKLVNNDQPIRFRKSCCFYYKATDPMEYCSNCPLVLAKQKKKK